MTKISRSANRLALAVLATLSISACDAADTAEQPTRVDTAADREALLAWNHEILDAAEAEDGFLTLKGLRTVTLVHLAVEQVLQAAQGDRLDPAEHPVEPVVAAFAAAHRIASLQYPDQLARWNQLRDRRIAAIDSEVSASDLEFGQEIADAALTAREQDGWSNEPDYQWHPMAPGVYAEFQEHSATPEGFIFGAGWALTRPFSLASPDQLRVTAPPEISSPAYTSAFNEVQRLGGTSSNDRTADQAHLAMWWKEFVESSHNRLARQLATEGDLDMAETNHLLARLNVAIFDAYVASFDSKFFYNHWRPYTAIRWAEHDGNPQTQADPLWDNLHRHTYAFPSYPSAHGTACGAAMTVFADTFGATRSFAMTIPRVDSAGPFSEKIEMDPASRTFESFSQAAEECALSRLYLGIHFRYDSTAGLELGRQVGASVLEYFAQ